MKSATSFIGVSSASAQDTNAKGSAFEEEEQEQALPPLMFFLASSLNVELVYLILTGLTSFSKLHESPFGGSFVDQSFQGPQVELTEDSGDSKIIIREVIIENLADWSSASVTEDYIENNRINQKSSKNLQPCQKKPSARDTVDIILSDSIEIAEESVPELTSLQKNMTVTFHQR